MTRVGRYELAGEIGRGASGIVYRATDPSIGRSVAVKIIRLDAFADAAERAKKSPHNAAAISARLDAILALDVRGLWPAIKCPTLVMVSPDDQIMPRWFGIEAANAIAGARLFEFDGGGHMLPETHTEVFVENVRAFLNERR